MARKRRSQLASVLAAIIDDSNIFDRETWAKLCYVSPSAISQWLSDSTLPRPENLRLLLHIAETTEGFPPATIALFRQIASRPSQEISPHARKIGPSLQTYLLGPMIDAMLDKLAVLPPEEQERLVSRFLFQCDGGQESLFEQVPGFQPPPLDAESVRQRYPERSQPAVTRALTIVAQQQPNVAETFKFLHDEVKAFVAARRPGSQVAFENRGTDTENICLQILIQYQLQEGHDDDQIICGVMARVPPPYRDAGILRLMLHRLKPLIHRVSPGTQDNDSSPRDLTPGLARPFVDVASQSAHRLSTAIPNR
jgi:transcriptional regulator with XRE-family HTH domain